MSKKVLDVGQCGPDHMAIKSLLESLGATVERVQRPAEALGRLRQEHFDLVLVNRKIDIDYTDGADLIRAMQADGALCNVPIMLISNFAEAQTEAVTLGALRGFGKQALGSADTRERLSRCLS